jgi:hypothetical protein
MSFAQFVKANYDKVKHLPNLERMKELSKMYNKDKPKPKAKKTKGGAMTGGVMTSA